MLTRPNWERRLGSRASALRYSLLASLGLVPVACGGSLQEGNDRAQGASGGSSAGSGNGGKNSGGAPAGTGNSTSGTASSVGGTGIGGSGVGAGGAAKGLPSCTSPQLDPATGLVGCEEGYSHRPAPQACDAAQGGAAGASEGGAGGVSEPAPALPRADGTLFCQTDPTQCDAYEHGYCDLDAANMAQPPRCFSGCTTDQDCGLGSVCVCDERQSPTGGACRPAGCATDDDCRVGYCATYQQKCGPIGFACQTLEDECVAYSDCATLGSCTLDSALQHRACNNAVCGRPFLVEAAPRLPPVVAGADWSNLDAPRPRVDHLTSAEREAQAAHFARLGQMEHASIAAFARFSLQLLALGAPPELLDACTQALADETAHTKLCFQIASAYAGRPLAPGRLDVAGSVQETRLDEVVDLVIAEGCFGETSAVLDALEAAESASDPVVRDAFSRIARDEERHAALAFRFVRWALEQGGDVVRERVDFAIRRPVAGHPGAWQVVVPCLKAIRDHRVAAPS